MYVYYVIRGTQAGEPVEYEGELTAELLPGVELDDGGAALTALSARLDQEHEPVSWDTSELTDSFFEREDDYLYYEGTWMRRSDTPIKR